MPFVYLEAAALQRKPKLGDGGCVALVRGLTGLKNRPTISWRQGERVLGNKTIRPGTAIATFVNGRWPRTNTGKHAAFFLRQDGNRIWIIDQWAEKELIESRPISPLGIRKDGTYPRTSDNADAFFVIE